MANNFLSGINLCHFRVESTCNMRSRIFDQSSGEYIIIFKVLLVCYLVIVLVESQKVHSRHKLFPVIAKLINIISR